MLDSDVPTVGQTRAIFALSCAALLFGLWVYWRHGGTAVSAVGVYNFAFALFVGFAGLYLLAGEADGESLLRALVLCYFGHVTTWLLFWTKDPPPEPPGPRPVDPAFLRRLTWIGVLVTCGGAVTSLELVGSLRHLSQAAGFVGALLVVIGLLDDERRPPLLGCLLAAGGFALSVVTSNSYGRLMLGSLGFALLIVIARRMRTRLVKALVIPASVPILLMMANMRMDAVRANHPGVQVTGTGLESVASPLEVFGTLLDHNDAGLLAHAWGHTFWAAVVSLIPRAVWPTKPPGFGAELVPILHPELVNSGHSDAALFQGEWLYNFGLIGLVLMVPIVGFAVRAADLFLARASARPLMGRHALLAYAAAVIVAAGLPDLAWGTFTFTVRAGMRLAVLVVVWFLITDRRIGWPGPTLPLDTSGRRSPTPGRIRPTVAGSSATSLDRPTSRSAGGSARRR
ncbi:hypothetical protein [Plantactinospora sp. KLBMP9567]|uniref:hypothetical protein n=1 Tax=Plantactinospora sp. KLBMP9567 TaxID=3085900 RepID=UPI002980D925|nr:hypothetical protein [Plantactinospora sp. KLBMP9567]MDW5330624.1 hypothetical protein [Plantactinospora sp. KLBMP9567]